MVEFQSQGLSFLFAEDDPCRTKPVVVDEMVFGAAPASCGHDIPQFARGVSGPDNRLSGDPDGYGLRVPVEGRIRSLTSHIKPRIQILPAEEVPTIVKTQDPTEGRQAVENQSRHRGLCRASFQSLEVEPPRTPHGTVTGLHCCRVASETGVFAVSNRSLSAVCVATTLTRFGA